MWHQCKHYTFLLTDSSQFKGQTPLITADFSVQVFKLHFTGTDYHGIYHRGDCKRDFFQKRQAVVKDVLNVVSTALSCVMSQVSLWSPALAWIYPDLWGLASGLKLWLWLLEFVSGLSGMFGHQYLQMCLCAGRRPAHWLIHIHTHTGVLDYRDHNTSTQLRHTDKSKPINGVLMWAGSWFTWWSDP